MLEAGREYTGGSGCNAPYACSCPGVLGSKMSWLWKVLVPLLQMEEAKDSPGLSLPCA